jgi:hypothetical protein
MRTKTEKTASDILISNQGTIFLFRPLTDAAWLHLELHCPDATWFGGALFCEHRYTLRVWPRTFKATALRLNKHAKIFGSRLVFFQNGCGFA